MPGVTGRGSSQATKTPPEPSAIAAGELCAPTAVHTGLPSVCQVARASEGKVRAKTTKQQSKGNRAMRDTAASARRCGDYKGTPARRGVGNRAFRPATSGSVLQPCAIEFH